jgi:conjugal transfer pilus assembly protein TraD
VSSSLRTVLTALSVGSVGKVIGKANANLSKKILDNTNTKIVLRVNDPETAKYVSNLGGIKRRFSPILSLGGGVIVREMEEEKILPDEALGLKPREFFAFTMNGIYKGRTTTVLEPKLKIKFPEIIRRRRS